MQRKTHTALAALMALGIAGGASAQSLGVDTGAGAAAGAGDKGSVSADVGLGANADVAKNDNAAGAGAGAGAGATTDGDMTVAGKSGVKTYGQLVSSLRNADTMNADLSGFGPDSEISVTTLSELQGEGAENAESLDQILSENQESVDELRANITANADLMDALQNEGYEVENVVAVETHGETGVTFFVDDTM